MTRFAMTLCLAALLTFAATAAPPKVGESAPELDLEILLQAPDGTKTTWEDLRGKVVVLEFWATWCGPCRKAIPHLNEIADEVREHGDIVLIAVTNESQEKIEGFLKKTPMKAWIGLDTDSSSHKRYNVQFIPHTVIVDKDGTIAAITSPTMLTTEGLVKLSAGDTSGMPAPSVVMEGDGDPGDGGLEPPSMESFDDVSKMIMEGTKPGDAHAKLEKLAGTWDMAMALTPMGEMGPSLETTGTLTRTWVLGNRFLEGAVKYNSDPAFEVRSVIGYDPEEEHYVMQEYSHFELAPTTYTGNFDETGNTLTFTRSISVDMMGMPDEDGEEVEATFKTVMEFADDDHYVLTMSINFAVPEGMDEEMMGGGEQVIWTITAIRAGAAAAAE